LATPHPSLRCQCLLSVLVRNGSFCWHVCWQNYSRTRRSLFVAANAATRARLTALSNPAATFACAPARMWLYSRNVNPAS